MANLFHYGGENNDVGYVMTSTSGASPAWLTGTTNPTPRLGVGRWFRSASGGHLLKSLPSQPSRVFVGAAPFGGSLDANMRPYIGIYGDGASTLHLCVGYSTTGVTVRRGAPSGTILASYNISLPTQSWLPYLEVEATIDDTAGVCKVRMDGVEVISFTGDTRNGGTGTTIDTVGLCQNGTPGIIWDDAYINDDSGSVNNTYAGPIIVRNLMPSGAGSSTQWTPDSGANYTQVNDTTINTATGVQSVTSNDLDLYAMADAPANTNIVKAVSVTAIGRIPDGGAASIKPVLRSGGANYEGATLALGSLESGVQQVWNVDPATSAAWTISGANAIEAGVKRV